MLKNNSAYVDKNSEKESARGQQEAIVDAVKKLGIGSCFDISLETGINHRGVQAAIGDLVRKGRIWRLPGPRYQERKYKLPNVKANQN